MVAVNRVGLGELGFLLLFLPPFSLGARGKSFFTAQFVPCFEKRREVMVYHCDSTVLGQIYRFIYKKPVAAVSRMAVRSSQGSKVLSSPNQ